MSLLRFFRGSLCWRTGFLAQFFPLFLLGALFGKLMEDSGSVTAIADFMTQKLGAKRVILAVVLGESSSPLGSGSAAASRSNTASVTDVGRRPQRGQPR